PRGLLRPALHRLRPLSQGSRGDQEAQRQRDPYRRSGSQRATGGLGQGYRRAVKGAILQEGYRVAEGLGEADPALSERQQPELRRARGGLQALLRLIATRSLRSEEHTSELQSLAYLVC